MILLEPIRDALNSISGEFSQFKKEVVQDFWICLVSRECSLLGRKEVLTGKAKFGILGDGKEVPQVAMARAFQKGDFRSGYYRDQTFMMALGLCTVQDYFAQLYADPANDPFSKGRQMNAHFSSPLLDQNGYPLDQTGHFNISADISSTAGQMARALGLALASKYYRNMDNHELASGFSNGGNEVCFCTIGDASTSEGIFWETLNAAAVMQVPLAVSVWDDGYGISVPIELQTVKQNISEALSGFEKTKSENGIKIFKTRGWNYPELVNIYKEGIEQCRTEHVPVLFHVREVTQPQGHSTSGSHERYKSKERLKWEAEYDCILKMEQWIESNSILSVEQCKELRELAKSYVRNQKNIAWSNFINPILDLKNELSEILSNLDFAEAIEKLNQLKEPLIHELLETARRCVIHASSDKNLSQLTSWIQRQYSKASEIYHSNVYSETDNSSLAVEHIPPRYSEHSSELNGYQILNYFFDQKFETDKRFFAFGEDVGKIGDVNQGFAGLQEKYGEHRIFDCGIREWSIVGQAIGTAMRGLKPIAEIQYLDYIVYALSPLMDDLATVRYRSGGKQCAPAIIRTRGHRLEGIWHSGSPIGMLLHSLRGICVCVPRNMTQAAGMYNTLLNSDDPGLVIECLNAYRLKEKLPDNMGSYTVPLGKVEILESGNDLTLVTYGSCVRIAQDAIATLKSFGISIELIDAQSLLPFDIENEIGNSLKKTNKLVVLDEDVPGGASAYILQQVLEVQGAYHYLDSPPQTITAKNNRPPYGSTGDYFTKPNAEDVVELIIDILKSYEPGRFSF
ncbi:MAG: transketolase [Saprospiraceae bacterium]|nr:transketolase [Saprospiraceae bacterium]